MEMRTSAETLDRIWLKWLNTYDGDKGWYAKHSYAYQNRKSQLCTIFEDWLWQHHARVMQSSHGRYIKFLDEEYATAFLLEWG